MKIKAAIISSLFLLGACSTLNGLLGTDTAPTTMSGKLKACSIEEATKKVQDGSAFTQSISASADEISDTCIKKLALQAAGLDNQASQNATNALQSLMSAFNKK